MGSSRRQQEDGTDPVDGRISLAKMRELLPANETYTDEYLIEVRQQLYDLAEFALGAYFENRKSGTALATRMVEGASVRTEGTQRNVSDQKDDRT